MFSYDTYTVYNQNLVEEICARVFHLPAFNDTISYPVCVTVFSIDIEQYKPRGGRDRFGVLPPKTFNLPAKNDCSSNGFLSSGLQGLLGRGEGAPLETRIQVGCYA